MHDIVKHNSTIFTCIRCRRKVSHFGFCFEPKRSHGEPLLDHFTRFIDNIPVEHNEHFVRWAMIFFCVSILRNYGGKVTSITNRNSNIQHNGDYVLFALRMRYYSNLWNILLKMYQGYTPTAYIYTFHQVMILCWYKSTISILAPTISSEP